MSEAFTPTTIKLTALANQQGLPLLVYRRSHNPYSRYYARWLASGPAHGRDFASLGKNRAEAEQELARLASLYARG